MSRIASCAPVFIKRVTRNWKHRNTSVSPARCPHELLECLCTLEPDAGVLDLGCGAGNLRAALRSRGWTGHFVGVDISGHAIEAAETSKDNNAEWHVSAIEDFQIAGQKVGAICLCESIYYAKPGAVRALLARRRQSLVPGGRIVIRIWNADLHSEYIAVLVGLGAQSSPPIYVLNEGPN